MDRLEQLIRFVEEDPHDPFNRYALALEYSKSDFQKAAELFEALLKEHEGYTPTYYHAAKLFESNGDINRAIAIYEKGIAVTLRQQERKAMQELKSALEQLRHDD